MHVNMDIMSFCTIFSIRFVGMVHVSPLLDNCINHIEKTLMFKTVEQVELLVGHYPPKLWIRGPAGSGKTMLLLEKAKSLASSILEHKKMRIFLLYASMLCYARSYSQCLKPN